MPINETVLEMHYHKPLMDLFRSIFGLGTSGGINFYKYSPQRECFLGFDQAYAKTELSEADFFDLLRGVANGSVHSLGDMFFGYFLQFKVVQEMRRRSQYTPPSIVSRPHYRAHLETRKKSKTGLSQHELLYNLNKAQGAMVYYACPMVFDRSALYEIDVDLDTLRLADLGSCPAPYSDNDGHFLYFADPQSAPVWRSDPVDGRAISPRDLASVLSDQLKRSEPAQSASDLLKLLTDVEAVGLRSRSDLIPQGDRPSVLSLVSESLTIVRVELRGGSEA